MFARCLLLCSSVLVIEGDLRPARSARMVTGIEVRRLATDKAEASHAR